MSQLDRLEKYFKSGGTLTVKEAIEKFGVYALSQRSGELKRKRGLDIRSEWFQVSEKTRVAKYYLHVPETLFQ